MDSGFLCSGSDNTPNLMCVVTRTDWALLYALCCMSRTVPDK